MSTALDITTGVCWSLVYILAIIYGIKHRTWCIPKLAICQNLAWEFWVVYYRIKTGSFLSLGYVTQLVWLILDIGVLLTLLAFERPQKLLWLNNIGLFSTLMFFMYFFAVFLNQWGLVAFVINVIMSVAFVIRAYKETRQWTSISIAILKLIGTLASTILEGFLHQNPIILWLGGICFIFDIYYLMMIRKGGGTHYGKP